MKNILLILLLSWSLGLFSQEKKYWEEGLLNWSDFQKPTISHDPVSSFEYRLNYKAQYTKIDDTRLNRYMADAYMIKTSSSIEEENRTWQYLKYYQLVFNLLEIERRALQEDLYLTRARYASQVVQEHRIRLKNTLEDLAQDTDKGNHVAALYLWENKIAALLEHYAPVQTLPALRKSHFAYGLVLGLGSSIYTGSVNDYFSPGILINFGFNISYKDFTFFAILMAGNNKVVQDYKKWEDWHIGGVAMADLSIGYPIFDGPKHKLTPFIGYGFSEFSRTDVKNEENNLRMIDPNWLIGLAFDYKLIKTIDTYRIKQYKETLLRFRLSMIKTDFSPDLQGYTLNFTIGFGNLGTLVKIPRKK